MVMKIKIMAGLIIINIASQAQIKYCTYWTAPTLSSENAEKLSKDNLVIIDYENLINNPEEVSQIKKSQPSLKLLVYSNPMEVWEKEMLNRNIANDFLSTLPSAYRLKRTDDKPVIFWKGMEMMNISSKCPKINGKNYVDYYSDWILSKILSNTLIDGYFIDNGTSTISWVDPKIDADNNKCADPPKALDNWWREGMIDFIQKIRKEKGDDFIIVTNKGETAFFFINNGVMFEKFPNDYLGGKIDYGWHQSMKNAGKARPYTIFQVDFSNLEFGLASSLLLDNVYIAVGQNMSIPDKYRINTGKPLNKAYLKNHLYYREFENVMVEVNPAKKTGKITKKN